ncbi:MAG: TonB-dependent receptor plug domain-containing protein, partial [Actinomycetota bacterium]
ITVAAALTEILLDAGVDVLLSNLGQAALVKRSEHLVVQPGSIVGRVTDAETGAGLAAAEVFLEGTRWRTLADEDGRFRLAEVEAGSYTLVVRRLGYGRQGREVSVSAGEETSVDLALGPTPTKLEEVVVTGTVVPTEVKALPTPVDVVTADDIEQQQIRRTDQIFRLFVPSAVAWDLGTAPEQTAITIRGASSLKGGTGVKIYVDGVEMTSTTFALIDPNSIERVEIIRGPQAATIYGPEAIGGVMQVFTKKGDPTLARPGFEAQASAGMLESEFKDGGTLRQEYKAGLRGGGASFGYNLGASYGHTGEWIPEFRLRTPSVYGGATFTQGPVSLELTSRYFATHQNAANQPRLVQAGLASPLPRHEELHTRLSTYG